eukprot:g3412.t1
MPEKVIVRRFLQKQVVSVLSSSAQLQSTGKRESGMLKNRTARNQQILVECSPFKRLVAGSSPARGSLCSSNGMPLPQDAQTVENLMILCQGPLENLPDGVRKAEKILN